MFSLRTKHSQGIAWDLLRGVLIAIAVTAAGVVLFALLIALFNFSDSVIRTVNQLIKLAAIAAGVHVSVSRGGDRGLIRGALVGLIYIGAGVIVYALLTGQRLTIFSCLADLCMGIAAGGLLGILRARRA